MKRGALIAPRQAVGRNNSPLENRNPRWRRGLGQANVGGINNGQQIRQPKALGKASAVPNRRGRHDGQDHRSHWEKIRPLARDCAAFRTTTTPHQLAVSL
jgi:hypothetical protein